MQMLFDPFEEQHDLAALAIQMGEQHGFDGKDVGQERDALVRLVLDPHGARCLGNPCWSRERSIHPFGRKKRALWPSLLAAEGQINQQALP